MSAAIKQVVTVQATGVLEVRSPELHAGDRAEVTIVVISQPQEAAASSGSGRWRRHAGAVNSANARAGDNQGIDADLAREYGGGASDTSNVKR